MANEGIYHEIKFSSELNKKFVFTLPSNLKYLLERMYGPLNKLKRVECVRTEGYIKPDVCITYNGIKKYVSLKTGTAAEVHRENIETLIGFLREQGVSERTLKTIVLFQYGDGTFDGSGKDRLDSNETFQWLGTRIQEANRELNSNKEVVKAFINKCLFQGICDASRKADYIYHGSTENGILVSKWQVEKYIDRKNFNFLQHLHIGPLLFRPHARYAHKKVIDDKSRSQMTIYWPNFRADLEYIDKRFGI